MNKKVSFEEVKERIKEELKKKSHAIGLNESVTLVDGFLNVPFSQEVSNTTMMNGPIVTMVMLVGNETAKIYFFALKALLKELHE